MGNKTRVEVTVYEKNEGDWGADSPPLVLESHRNDSGGRYVVLISGKQRIVVTRGDLEAAIRAVTAR